MQQPGKRQRADTLSAVLTHAADHFGNDPAGAETKGAEILNSIPGQQQALLLLVCARRLQGDKEGARAVLEAMAEALPGLAAVHYELGLVLGGLGETKEAIAALSRVVELEPNDPSAWRALGNQLGRAGDDAGAGRVFAKHLSNSLKELALLEGATAQPDTQLGTAEAMLRELLNIHRTDVSAMHMLAKIALRLNRFEDAEKLLIRALELSPGFAAARHDLIMVLDREMKWRELLVQADIALKHEPLNIGYRGMKAQSLGMLGEYERAKEGYEALLADHPEVLDHWIGYGHVLRSIGRTDDAIAAYRRSVELRPGFGSAYMSLANLKTFRFTVADVETMQDHLRRFDLPDKDRRQLHFALGKALEDRGDYADSFENYRKGSALRRKSSRDDPQVTARHVSRSKALFGPGFFRARAGFGCPSPDPIFIVGLPRSGSTLIEQILSSHSAIEGTTELQDITHLTTRLDEYEGKYPDILKDLGRSELTALGEEYLERTRVHRKLGRPFFIDKMPSNFEHVGLIQLILPNAKIIDARRHPLGCGFSNFKQRFRQRNELHL